MAAISRVRPRCLGLSKAREFEFPELEKALIGPKSSKAEQIRGKFCICLTLRNDGTSVVAPLRNTTGRARDGDAALTECPHPCHFVENPRGSLDSHTGQMSLASFCR